ncbi:PIG-L deacetylase family protein [Thermodesulfobacteriota bacterium]
MGKTIAVIAAHPDDEVLGCGGVMAKHDKAGDAVHVLILAEGVTSRSERRDRCRSREGLAELACVAQKANSILGVNSLRLHDFPDNRMDSVDLLDVVKVTEGFLREIQPDVVYTHHGGDLNVDHRVVHEAVVTVCRPMPGRFRATLLFFEVASSSEWQVPGSAFPFVPNWFEDISESVTLKMQALRVYSPEMRAWPHARSIEALQSLAAWRGATVGVEAAEAFVLGRYVG